MDPREAIRARKLAVRDLRADLVGRFGIADAYEIVTEVQLDLEEEMGAAAPTPAPVPAAHQPERPRGPAKPGRDEDGPTALALDVLRAAHPHMLTVAQVHKKLLLADPNIERVYVHQILSRLANKEPSPVVRHGSPFAYGVLAPHTPPNGSTPGPKAPPANGFTHPPADSTLGRVLALFQAEPTRNIPVTEVMAALRDIESKAVRDAIDRLYRHRKALDNVDRGVYRLKAATQPSEQGAPV